MAVTDFKSPTNVIYSYAITDPTNIYSSDDAYAIFTSLSSLTTLGTFGDFGLPTNCIIDGIEMVIEGYYTGTGLNHRIRAAVWNQHLHLLQPSSSEYSVDLTSTDAEHTIGDSEDKWTMEWERDDFNNGTFYIRLTSSSFNVTDMRLDNVKVRIYYTEGHQINVSDDVTVEDSVSMYKSGVEVFVTGGLAGLPYRGVDMMEFTKDLLRNNAPSTITDNVIDCLADNFNLTHIGIAIPMNTQAEATAEEVDPFDQEPASYASQFTTKIHAKGLGVLFRGTDCYFEYTWGTGEGLYNFPYWDSYRNGNRYTYLADDITDDFSSDTIDNYATTGTWSISGGTLFGSDSDQWKNTCLFMQDFDDYWGWQYLNNVTLTAKVRHTGNNQIIVRASTDSNYPGYGLQMRGYGTSGTLRIERPGLEMLAETSFAYEESYDVYYWLKLDAQGSTIRGKCWKDGDAEPGTWNLQVTDSTYSYGYCGFSSEVNETEVDEFTIEITQDTDTWLYRACEWIDANYTLFADGDIIAPYPEADIHQQLDEQGTYQAFFNDLAYCLGQKLGARGLSCVYGFSSQQFPGVLQMSRSGPMFTNNNMIPLDHYGYPVGLNERFSSGDSARQVNVGGSDTYTIPSTLSENAVDKCSFIPEKGALNMDIDVYVVERGTGDWTMTIHDQYDNPVQLPDHTDFLSKTNSYQATVLNGALVNDAWNTFRVYWDNPLPDVTYHFHLTTNGSGATARVLSGQPGNMEYIGHEQFKTNATPEAMEIDMRKVYWRHGSVTPIFEEEWGDFWSLDPTRSSPIRTEQQHIEYLQSMYAAFGRLATDGILQGFNYWRATGGNEKILYNAGTDESPDYQLLYTGIVLQEAFEGGVFSENIQVSESVQIQRIVDVNTRLINIQDEYVTVEDAVETTPPDTLYIPAGDYLDQSQPLGNTYAGFGQFAYTRYRGMGFKMTGTVISAIAFHLQYVGSYGIKVYIDSADADSIPDHAVGSELYSFVIPNSQLSADLTAYNLPVPLTVTPGAQYCFYLAPWNTSTNQYADDYRDANWQNADVYSNGGPIVNTNGTWAVSDSGNLDMRFQIYTQTSLDENVFVSESVAVEVSEAPPASVLSVDISKKGVVIVD